METKFFNFFLKEVLPRLRFSNTYSEMEGEDFKWIYELAQPGDILLSVDYKNLSTSLIGGDFAHAAVVIEKGLGRTEISEMVSEGYRESHIANFCYHADRVALIRIVDPKYTPQYIEKLIANVRSFEGDGYNRQFMPHDNPDEYWKNKKGDKVYQFHYCSQMFTDADEDHVGDFNWGDLMGLGIPYISPDGLYRGKNIEIIFDTIEPGKYIG